MPSKKSSKVSTKVREIRTKLQAWLKQKGFAVEMDLTYKEKDITLSLKSHRPMTDEFIKDMRSFIATLANRFSLIAKQTLTLADEVRWMLSINTYAPHA